ncbi:MAG TPA: Rieske 2Fe-2S domain-containing protein [Candidatus Dormibacteraeota bacterium]|nr:Rieske 2Fe-2S domain-containing protein [Candidatus Dormibacteraeota bacterium]
MRHELFGAEELRPGQMREVQVDGVSIVVVRKADGTYRALRNRCSHQGGPLSGGRLEPMQEGDRVGDYRPSPEREVLRCPWHHYEFDVDTGLSPADPERVRVRTYEVTVADGRVFLERRGGRERPGGGRGRAGGPETGSPPAAQDPPHVTLPREVLPGLHWLGSCLEILPRIQQAYLKDAGQEILHAHQSFFLIVGSRATAIVDTGQPQHWPVLERQLTQVLGDRPLDYILPTHPEYVHFGLLPYWLQRYPRARVVGDLRNFHLFYPELTDRFEFRRPGDVLDLGDRALLIVEAIIHDLPNSLWAYDTGSQTLFSSDAFAYSHAHNAGECALTSVELPARLDDVAMTISSALHWARYVDDIDAIFERIRAFAREHPIRAIAPAHGSFVLDPEVMMELLPRGFKEVRVRARG